MSTPAETDWHLARLREHLDKHGHRSVTMHGKVYAGYSAAVTFFLPAEYDRPARHSLLHAVDLFEREYGIFVDPTFTWVHI
jgi:hypothetical protein